MKSILPFVAIISLVLILLSYTRAPYEAEFSGCPAGSTSGCYFKTSTGTGVKVSMDTGSTRLPDITKFLREFSASYFFIKNTTCVVRIFDGQGLVVYERKLKQIGTSVFNSPVRRKGEVTQKMADQYFNKPTSKNRILLINNIFDRLEYNLQTK